MMEVMMRGVNGEGATRLRSCQYGEEAASHSFRHLLNFGAVLWIVRQGCRDVCGGAEADHHQLVVTPQRARHGLNGFAYAEAWAGRALRHGLVRGGGGRVSW